MKLVGPPLLMGVCGYLRLVAGDTDISDDAVHKATGRSWRQWFDVLDEIGIEHDHTTRARLLSDAEPGLTGWWVQMITVQFERERGLRKVGWSSSGGYQVSVTKTFAMDAERLWHSVLSSPAFADADWVEGATWSHGEEAVEVRRVAPAKLLRWFESKDSAKSTVELHFDAKAEKTTLTIRHHGLADEADREPARARWKNVMETIPLR